MSLHLFPDVIQGSDDWHARRRGIVTASVVDRLLTTREFNALDVECPDCGSKPAGPCASKVTGGKAIKTPHAPRVAAAAQAREDRAPELVVADNRTSRALTATLAAERITGWTEETARTPDMWRGVECEPFARNVYSEHYGPVTEVGFMVREEDGWRLGYSPDGVVGSDGLIEIKSPQAKEHLRTILAGEVPAEYVGQLQAGLLVSGRAWIDYVSYVGGMHLYVKRVLPDPAWHAAIITAVTQFETTATAMVAAYTQATTDMPATERPSLEIVI